MSAIILSVGTHRIILESSASWIARIVKSTLFSSVFGFELMTESNSERQSVAWACFRIGPVFKIESPVRISVSVALT